MKFVIVADFNGPDDKNNLWFYDRSNKMPSITSLKAQVTYCEGSQNFL